MRSFLSLPALVMLLAVASCKEDSGPTTPPVTIIPTDTVGPNQLTNASFTPSSSFPDAPDIWDTTFVPPWDRATGTPQISSGPGADGKAGYIMIWGSADNGESILQRLPSPILKGHTYRVSLDAAWFLQDTAAIPHYAVVRFTAFNTVPKERHWPEHHPDVAVIGSIGTTDSTWKRYSTRLWTADADYAGFAFNVENFLEENALTTNHSWVRIDNVELAEVHPHK